MAVTPRVPHETEIFPDAVVKVEGVDYPVSFEAMSRTWIIFLERLGKGEWIEGGNGDTEYKATFGLNRELTVANRLTNRYIAQKAGRFSEIYATGLYVCRGSEGRIRIRKKPYQQLGDPPTLWVNIFHDIEDEDGYISLVDGDAIGLLADEVHVQYWTIDAEGHPFAEGEDGTIEPGDVLEIDCLQIGSEYPGKNFEIVLRWEPIDG